MSRLTVMQLRTADAVCRLAAIADAVWLAWLFFRDRIIFISGDSHPTSFSPVTGPPAWVYLLGLAAIAVLYLASELALDPAISRALRAAVRERERTDGPDFLSSTARGADVSEIRKTVLARAREVYGKDARLEIVSTGSLTASCNGRDLIASVRVRCLDYDTRKDALG